MAEAECFHDAFISILEELQMLKQMQDYAANSSEPSPNSNNSSTRQQMANLLTNLEAEFSGTITETRPISPGFRKRSRKQKKEDISRVDMAKAEEEEILERLKKDECRGFLDNFCKVLPNFTPSDAVFREKADLGHNLEVCKRLAGRVGWFMREKEGELAAENTKVEQLEEELKKENKLMEKLMEEMVELDRKLEAAVSAASKGSKADCPYCSKISGELGQQKNQILSNIVFKFPKTNDLVSSDIAAIFDPKSVQESETPVEHALEGCLVSNCLESFSEAASLKPLTMQVDGVSEEMEFMGIGTNSAKYDDPLKSNQSSLKAILCMDSMQDSVFPECQEPGNVTKVNVQRDTILETIELDGKTIDHKLIVDNVEVENECKLDNGDKNQEKNHEAESKDYQRHISTVNAREELNGPDDYSEGTSYDENYLNRLLDLENEYGFIEIKCGCTSLKNVDTVGTLRIYKSGLFEIYCECGEGCNEGKPMSPVAFKLHGGHGANRKWTNSIWILMRHEKVQLSKAEILEPYCRKYKEMETMKDLLIENTSHTSHTNASIRGIELHEKPSLRPRKRDSRNAKRLDNNAAKTIMDEGNIQLDSDTFNWQLKANVAQICETRQNPFRDGFLVNHCGLDSEKVIQTFAIRTAEGLDRDRALNLRPAIVTKFYDNLAKSYGTYSYGAHKIWNCDETGLQAGRNCGVRVIAKRVSRNVPKVIPKSRE
ncbi:hypothetical protein KI387_032584 [Taxus chinensis]|uniref:ULTRAPETALA1/2 SAND domain-containing protein n=1 Tax=Taxus chinensis TaxID=29808 RepID=A0AA38BS67_TAXCH|nr:hypothetical protein KI387_032584 [Taxus chinensis]